MKAREVSSNARSFLAATLILIAGGVLIFISASFGIAARKPQGIGSLVLRQFGLGFGAGIILLLLTSRIRLGLWKKYSLYFFLFSLLLTLCVFIPSLGFEHGGAKRWIAFNGFTFQPSELLKFSFILYLASWLGSRREKEISSVKEGLLPFLIITGFAGIVLIVQPDIGTLGVLCLTATAMFFMAGAKIRHIILIFILGIALVYAISLVKSHATERILVFLNPSYDPQGIGYQIKQSRIAIGSGGLTGRGFGQSIQKFKYLPEPMGDSIFAVFAEEFGFLGSLVLIVCYLFFLNRGLKIAGTTRDKFTGLSVAGIAILIVLQSFVNIGSMIGILPLTGLPLIFISQGGSALAITLGEIGFILSAARARA